MKRTTKLPHWPPRLPGLAGWFRWHFIPKAVLVMAVAGALTTLVFVNLDFYQIGSGLARFREGQPAAQDVVAPRTVAWTDARATQAKRDQAESLVQPERLLDVTAVPGAQQALDSLFHRLSDARTQAVPAPAATYAIPPMVINAARQLSPTEIERLHLGARDMLSQMLRMQESYAEENVTQLLDRLATSRTLTPDQQLILTTLCNAALKDAWVYEPSERTEARRQQARDSIPDVTRTFQAGEIIIHRGDRLSGDDLAQLKRLLSPAPLERLVPLAAMALFAVLALGIYLRNYVSSVYQNMRKLILLCILILIPLYFTYMLGRGENEALVALIFIPGAAMAIAGLLGMPTAIVSTILLSIFSGIAAENQYAVTLLTMGSSLAGMMAVSAIWPARRAVPAVLSLIGVNLILRLCQDAILTGSGSIAQWHTLARIGVDAVGAGFGATIIAVGAIYMLARSFGITTHYRLMELSNPNEPLLRKMMKDAPGSYHSSVMVANIAEATADAIGANALLTRVAALYHDVGKLKRPGFFVENQAPLGLENVHQRLTPKLSYLILISHVKDGVETAKEYKLPGEVTAIIGEHHGTTLAAYFYHRAMSEAGNAAIPEHEFRYPGPKPSTKESAVVMLSDSVQASVKSLKDPNPARIENMVNDIIASRLDDGQLEDCDLTQRDLRRIADVFIRILSGLYTYTRIEYPDLKSEGPRLRANLNSEPAAAAGEPAAAAPGN